MAQPATRVTLLLELDRSGEQISGSVGAADGPRQDFHGWLELSALLEQARGYSDRGTARACDPAATDS